MSESAKRRRWIAVLLALSAVAIGCALYAAYRYGDEDIYVQNIDGTGTHLRIPHRYKDSSNGGRGSVLHFIALGIPNPELAALTKDAGGQNPSVLEMDELDFKIYIELRISGSKPMEEIFYEAIQSANFVESQPGSALDVYRVYSRTSATDYEEYLVSQAQDRPRGQSRTIMNCGAYVGAPLNKYLWNFCYANVQYTESFYVIYHVPRHALSEWRSIEANVLAYLRKVTVDCFQSDPSSHDISRMHFQACTD